MYSAKITDVRKLEDKVTVDVEFSNGIDAFKRTYDFVMKNDVDVTFDATVKMELERINDLQLCFDILLPRLGEIKTDTRTLTPISPVIKSIAK